MPDEANLFGDRQLRVELLTSRVTSERRRELLRDLADSSIDILIGTHALIEDAVEFVSLGVVVIDEQHRFGVEQRAALRNKGSQLGTSNSTSPDVLVMAATPIPRTAAMTIYGDLDVSVLDELPPGRTPIKTLSVAGKDTTAKMWAEVRDAIAQGQQAFVVCPLIDESEKLEVASAEKTFATLGKAELKGLRLGLLHGRMSSSEKDATMGKFRDRELDVLVATTMHVAFGTSTPTSI
ncbi:MAG: helicase-related protein, partial [Actinomycetota bacterium]